MRFGCGLSLGVSSASTVPSGPAPDVTAPTLLSAAWSSSGLTCTLTYSETLDNTSTPATGDYALGGVIFASVSGVLVSGATVVLTSPRAVLSTETGITVSYTPGSNKIKDVAGNLAAALVAQATTNGSTYTYDPIVDETGCVLEVDLETSSLTFSSASVANGDDFSNASWTKTQCTVSANADGVADRVTISAAATTPQIASAITNGQVTSTAVPMTFSFQAKFETVQWLMLETRTGVAAHQTFFDIQNGVVGTAGANNVSPTISAADGSGYRTITCTVSGFGAGPIFRVYLSSTDVTITAVVGSTVLLKGATITQVRIATATNRKTGGIWANAAAASQPGYSAAGLGSKPCGLYNTTQTISLAEAGVYGALADSSPYTLFYVAAPTNFDSLGVVFGVGNSGTASNKTKTWGQNITGSGRHRAAVLNDAGGDTSVEAAATPGTPNAAAVVEWFSTGTAVSCQHNGGAADPNASAQTAGTTTLNNAAIGCRPDSVPDTFYAGSIAIVALWNTALSSAARSRIRQYYASKRGITVTP